MRLYKITASYLRPDSSKDDVTKFTQFVGSKAEGVSVRKDLMEDGARRKDIAEVEVDVPTGKSELIGWLNANVK